MSKGAIADQRFDSIRARKIARCAMKQPKSFETNSGLRCIEQNLTAGVME